MVTILSQCRSYLFVSGLKSKYNLRWVAPRRRVSCLDHDQEGGMYSILKAITVRYDFSSVPLICKNVTGANFFYFFLHNLLVSGLYYFEILDRNDRDVGEKFPK